MMDKKISTDKLRKKRVKLYVKIAVAVVVAIVILIVLSNVLKPSISSSATELSIAETGPLEISIGASGTVVPFYEEVITSPINSKILEVHKKSGEHLKKGDTLIRLDLSSANVDFQSESGKPAKIDPTKTVKTDPLKTDETDPLKTGEVDPLKTE